jgi:hypothetical protein
MSFIKELIFGVKRVPVDNIIIGTHTISLDDRPTYEEWCKEFRVSSLYDRKVIHLY